MATQRVFQDRVVATKWAWKYEDGQRLIVATADASVPEPVMLDGADGVTKWKVFVSDGEVGQEVTADPVTAPVVLQDIVTSLFWKIIVDGGQLGRQLTSGGVHSVLSVLCMGSTLSVRA